jgi:chemotaxis signal transduction protein
MKYSAFYVGDGLYSVPIHETEELARIPRITPVPTVDGRVAGLVNLRGKVAVALNLRACLESPPASGGGGDWAPRPEDAPVQRHMIIMESGKNTEGETRPDQIEDPVVLIVDRIHGIVDDEGLELLAPPAHVQKPFISGIIQSRDKLIVVLSVAKLVNEILKAGA